VGLENQNATYIEWVVDLGLSGEPVLAATPRSQKRDLGHPTVEKIVNIPLPDEQFEQTVPKGYKLEKMP
jgi:hypothetical protein